MKHHFEQLRLDSVSRSFTNAEGQAVAALQGLDLNIQRGEFIALLGPSGCGKTTALNCIAGLQPLSGGGIWLDDKRIDVLPPEKRGFGMVFQNYALFPHMSVLDNVGFGLKMRGVARSEAMRRAREALQLVQLVGHERKLPGQLSGGQQQRVAIARAIVIEPPLILMDEPLSNLDTKLRIEMRAEIRRIHSQLERATLYVTHDQDEALSMADRIVVMKEGVVQQVGTPKEVYTRPQNLHVARFMGYRNVIEFALEGTQGDAVAVSANGVRLIGTPMAGFNSKRVSVALRPEDIERAAPGAENAFERISLRVPPSRTLVYDGEAA
jgi:putative spermidine/putrescine transport system ATP-binding protein